MINQDYSKNDYTRKKGIGERIVEALPYVFMGIFAVLAATVIAVFMGSAFWTL